MLSLTGACGSTGAFMGQEDYHRNYLAGFLICSIEREIPKEVNKENPNGYLNRSYSESHWNEYWNDRLYYTLSAPMDEKFPGYRGPSSGAIAIYILQRRRQEGLPDVELDERNRSIRAMYRNLDSGDQVTEKIRTAYDCANH